jgi:hypothetical protein
MELPIKFLTDTEVIREETDRFRALSTDEQNHELGESFRLYHFLRDTSGRGDEIDRQAELDELRGREAIMAFVANHG